MRSLASCNAKKEKNLMKKTVEKTTYKLKEVIKKLNLKPEEEVFIHYYGKGDEDQKLCVEEIDSKTLNKIVVLVNKNFGGVECNYSSNRFIIKK